MGDRVTVAYFDDSPYEQVKEHIRQLEKNLLDIELLSPPADMDLGSAVQKNPELFLVDYDLTEVNEQGTHANYMGSTLAARIREKFPEHPIVLLTRRSLESWKSNQYLLEKLQVFDWVMFKDDDAGSSARILLSLATTFSNLRQIRDKDLKSLRGLLGATDEEMDLVKEAGPPLDAGRWQVSILARWLQHVLLRYPGVLYDRIHAATYVGLDEASFGLPEVREIFRAAEYTGCFCDILPRWWKKRLLSIAKGLLLDLGIDGPVRLAMAETLRKHYGLDVRAPKCIYSGESPADTVCFILNQPVMYRYSLAYHPDSRPPVMDEARVSFKAIRESNEVMEELFDADAKPVVSRIRSEVGPA